MAVVLGFASCEKKPTGGTASKAPVIEFSHPTLKTDNANFEVTILYEGTDLSAEWRIEDPAKPNGTGIGGTIPFEKLGGMENNTKWLWRWDKDQAPKMATLSAEARFVFTVTYGKRAKTVSDSISVEVTHAQPIVSIGGDKQIVIGMDTKFTIYAELEEGASIAKVVYLFLGHDFIDEKKFDGVGFVENTDAWELDTRMSDIGFPNATTDVGTIKVLVTDSNGEQGECSIAWAPEACFFYTPHVLTLGELKDLKVTIWHGNLVQKVELLIDIDGGSRNVGMVQTGEENGEMIWNWSMLDETDRNNYVNGTGPYDAGIGFSLKVYYTDGTTVEEQIFHNQAG